MAKDDAVHAEGLVKEFGDVKALDGLNLVVPKAKLLAFLGQMALVKPQPFGFWQPDRLRTRNGTEVLVIGIFAPLAIRKYRNVSRR